MDFGLPNDCKFVSHHYASNSTMDSTKACNGRFVEHVAGVAAVGAVSDFVQKSQPTKGCLTGVRRWVPQNAARLDSEIIYDRDFDYDYFGFKVGTCTAHAAESTSACSVCCVWVRCVWCVLQRTATVLVGQRTPGPSRAARRGRRRWSGRTCSASTGRWWRGPSTC